LLNEYNQKIIHDEVFNYLKQFKVVNAGTKMFDFYIVKITKMPSLLLELLSVNNLKDCDLLKDEIFLDGLCESIVKGIVSCLKLNFAPKIIEE
jgi:N-acetylmuramoyl-L-alanine amidase